MTQPGWLVISESDLVPGTSLSNRRISENVRRVNAASKDAYLHRTTGSKNIRTFCGA